MPINPHKSSFSTSSALHATGPRPLRRRVPAWPPARVAELAVRLAEKGVVGINLEDGTEPGATVAATAAVQQSDVHAPEAEVVDQVRGAVLQPGKPPSDGAGRSRHR